MSKRYQHVCTLHALSGDCKPLANYFEEGGELLPCMREFLVGHLRGDFRFGPGRRRTFEQKQRDLEIGDDVRFYQEVLKVSRAKAIERYLDDNPDVNRDTLKSTLKRYDDDRKLARERIEHVLKEQRLPPLEG